MVDHVKQSRWRLASKPKSFGVLVGGTGGDGRDEEVGDRLAGVAEVCPGAEARLQAQAVGGGQEAGRAGRVAGHDVGAGRA